MTGVDPEPQVRLDGRVERDRRGLLGELDRLGGLVDTAVLDQLRRFGVLLAVCQVNLLAVGSSPTSPLRGVGVRLVCAAGRASLAGGPPS
jgi:hypothetical protein